MLLLPRNTVSVTNVPGRNTREVTMSEVVRASLSIDSDLMSRFDQLIERSGLGNRSEVMRDLIRGRLMDEAWDSGEDGAVATVTLIYDHERRRLTRQMEDIGHAHHSEVMSSLHIHLDHHSCLEVIVLRGEPKNLRQIANHLMGLKGVLHGQAVFCRVPTNEDRR